MTTERLNLKIKGITVSLTQKKTLQLGIKLMEIATFSWEAVVCTTCPGMLRTYSRQICDNENWKTTRFKVHLFLYCQTVIIFIFAK